MNQMDNSNSVSDEELKAISSVTSLSEEFIKNSCIDAPRLKNLYNKASRAHKVETGVRAVSRAGAVIGLGLVSYGALTANAHTMLFVFALAGGATTLAVSAIGFGVAALVNKTQIAPIKNEIIKCANPTLQK